VMLLLQRSGSSAPGISSPHITATAAPGTDWNNTVGVDEQHRERGVVTTAHNNSMLNTATFKGVSLMPSRGPRTMSEPQRRVGLTDFPNGILSLWRVEVQIQTVAATATTLRHEPGPMMAHQGEIDELNRTSNLARAGLMYNASGMTRMRRSRTFI